MGYYTRHIPITDLTKDQINWLKEKTGYKRLSIEGYETCTWYGFIQDLSELSKLYKDQVFAYDLIGEADDDFCRLFFKDGEHKRIDPVITWPDEPEF